MDILTIIIEGCGGGINYKEYFKTQLPYQWLCVLDVGGYYKTSFHLPSFQMTLCYLIVSLNDTVDDIGITSLTYQSKLHLTEKGLTTNGRIYNLS